MWASSTWQGTDRLPFFRVGTLERMHTDQINTLSMLWRYVLYWRASLDPPGSLMQLKQAFFKETLEAAMLSPLHAVPSTNMP